MIEKDKATITSLAIEVKVIKVGNRQMTLSVFDQLPCGLKKATKQGVFGNVWGKVMRKESWHIVTEFEGKLWSINMYSLLILRKKALSALERDLRKCVESIEWMQHQKGVDDEISQKQQEVEEIKSAIEWVRKNESQDSDLLASLDQLFIAV